MFARRLSSDKEFGMLPVNWLSDRKLPYKNNNKNDNNDFP